jgi:hypothetical protein
LSDYGSHQMARIDPVSAPDTAPRTGPAGPDTAPPTGSAGPDTAPPTGSAGPDTASDAAPPARRAPWPRRHAGILALLVAGAALRLAVIVAYRPAFWFSDTINYLYYSKPFEPDTLRPNGYPAFLLALRFTGDLAYVAIVQHIVGLALVVVGYAFLRRRGVAGWLAVLGTAPLALDPRLVVMEHYIMAESLFIAAVLVGLVLLLWRERPGPALCAGASALLLVATLTRSIGLPVALMGLAFVVVRWLGWRAAVVYAAVLILPLVGYAAWYNSYYGHYNLSGWQGRFLYARTAQIADCRRLPLTSEERPLCPQQPLNQRPERADYYLWSADSPASKYGVDSDELLQGFAVKVIMNQKRDYLRLIGRDTATFFLPWRHVGPQTDCLNGRWYLADGDGGDQPGNLDRALRQSAADQDCQANLTVGYTSEQGPVPTHSSLRAALTWYSRHVQVPGPVLLLGLLVAVVVAIWRPRRAPNRYNGIAALMIAGCGFALAAGAFATAMLDFRFGVPAVPLMVLGGVLAVHQLLAAKSPSAAAAGLPTPAAALDASRTTAATGQQG